MKMSGLQLKKYFYPEASVVSVQKGEELPSLPEVKVEAFMHSPDTMHVSLRVIWGEADKSKYNISVLVYGSFEIPPPDPAEEKNLKAYLKRYIPPLATNAAQVLLGAVRERIFSMTAAGPHGRRTLPTLVLEEDDATIYLSNEVSEIMGVATETKRPPAKKTAASRKKK